MRGIMLGRLLRLSVLALAGGLMAVLVGHMWDHYSQQAEATGLERYLGAYVVSPSKDQDPISRPKGAPVQRVHKKHRPCTTEILRARNGGFDARFPESRGWLSVLILPRLFQGRR